MGKQVQENELMEHSPNSNNWNSWWSAPSVYASVALLLIMLFDWGGGESFHSFIFALAEGIAYLVFIAVFIGTLVKAFTTKTEKGLLRFKFVVFDLLVAFIAIFFPFRQFMKICDFNVNFERRMEVVKMIKEGKIVETEFEGRSAYRLPEGWQDLSHGGGEVMVIDANRIHRHTKERNLHIVFYINRGLLEHYSGFEYCSDGKPGNVPDKPKSIEPLRENWYWVAY